MEKPVPLARAGFTESKKRPTADRLNTETGVEETGWGDLSTLMCAGTSGIKEVYATF
jgi:hypothetical protein